MQPRPQMHVGSSCAERASMFRLQRRAVAFTRIRDEGEKSLTVRKEHRPPNAFYPSCGLLRHRRQNVTSLADHTEPGLSSTLLPAPQRETDGEEEIIVVTLTPRFKRHVTGSYVGGSGIILQFVDQGLSIFDAFGYPNLPLLEGGHGREDEIALWHTPVAVRATRTLQGGLRSRDADAPEVHLRHSFRGCAAPLELRVQHIHY